MQCVNSGAPAVTHFALHDRDLRQLVHELQEVVVRSVPCRLLQQQLVKLVDDS
eukprot:EC848869.1.p3 GENE.EC848869.1~~EC848869.1.p3  ORF type:complete len:53 (-),score=5.42 EC848869.1:37-195(-)